MPLSEPKTYSHYGGTDTLPVRILRLIGSRKEKILCKELQIHFTDGQRSRLSCFSRGLGVLRSRGHIRREEDSSGKWWLITQKGEEYLINIDNPPIKKNPLPKPKLSPPPRRPRSRSLHHAPGLMNDGGRLLRLETDEDWVAFLLNLLPRGGFDGEWCSMFQLAVLAREKREQCGYDVSSLVLPDPQATILVLGRAVNRVAPLMKKRGLAVCRGIGLRLEISLMTM